MTSTWASSARKRSMHHRYPASRSASQLYTGLPQRCPSELRLSGGTPATKRGRRFSSSRKYSGQAQTSLESGETKNGKSPIRRTPRSWAYSLRACPRRNSRNWAKQIWSTWCGQFAAGLLQDIRYALHQFHWPLQVMGAAEAGFQRAEEGVVFQPVRVLLTKLLEIGLQIPAGADLRSWPMQCRAGGS